MEGTQGRNLEKETDTATMEERCRVVYLAYFLIAPRTTNPGVTLPTVSRLGPPTATSIKTMHHRLVYRRSGGSMVSNEVSSSK